MNELEVLETLQRASECIDYLEGRVAALEDKTPITAEVAVSSVPQVDASGLSELDRQIVIASIWHVIEHQTGLRALKHAGCFLTNDGDFMMLWIVGHDGFDDMLGVELPFKFDPATFDRREWAKMIIANDAPLSVQ